MLKRERDLLVAAAIVDGVAVIALCGSALGEEVEVAEVVPAAAERVAAGRRLLRPLVRADHARAQLDGRLPPPRRAGVAGGGRDGEHLGVRERRAVGGDVVGAAGEQERGQGEDGERVGAPGSEGAGRGRAGVGS